MTATVQNQLAHDGFVMLPAVFTVAEAATIAAELDNAVHRNSAHTSAVARGETIVAARNILDTYPAARDLWRKPSLITALVDALGPRFGLMRGLFFDKPPTQSWSLPWHQDRAIAVKDNRLPSTTFGKPTTKAGVPHVESPLWLSRQILLLRLHLDAMVEENGPLQVLPGSHREDASSAGVNPITLNAEPGDVLLMSPLLVHRSGEARQGTTRHRRVLHLEFTGVPELPDGYAWHTFVPGLSAGAL
jgi:hypothetical protein